jgi:NAD+ synthase (glutamine-hydrolysing)
VTSLRVALAQINPRVGDLAGNASLILRYAQHAKDGGADIAAFPELALNGYPVEDLGLRGSFIAASKKAIEQLALDLETSGCGDLVALVGYLDGEPDRPGQLGRPHGFPRNAVAAIYQGQIVARYFKHHLPNYGVFDEQRYFVPGIEPLILQVRGSDVAVAICEDIWQEGGPISILASAQPGLVVVINGSPYERNKDDARLELCASRARMTNSALAYVNMVGGQDELIFEGDSIAVTSQGEVLARAPQFHEGLMLVDFDLPPAKQGTPGVVVISDAPAPERKALTHGVAPRLDDLEEIWNALLLGLRDYVEKNGFSSVVMGLSGGIDSAVVAALAVDALGPDRVHGVSLPSEYSSQHSRDDALDLAARTGLNFRVVEIPSMVDAFVDALDLKGLAEENVQARVRGTTLMALSNQEGHLVLATGNKSELAVGYSTIYGDAVGGFAPIKDVPKTLVWELARWRNSVAALKGEVPPIPDSSIEKEPSAELRPGQLDTDSLPDYATLDRILEAYVESDRGAFEVVDEGFDPETVERILRMVDRAEYKRQQYPPGPKISLRSFGRDRRLPITSGWQEKTSDPVTRL